MGKITTKIGNHTFRATGVTAYLKNGGTLENAALMANHASTRTTQTAFVANNSLPRAELAALFEGLHAALKSLGGLSSNGTENQHRPILAKGLAVDRLLDGFM